MPAIKFYDHEPIPVEMHKVKIVQQLQLLPAEQRLEKMREAGFNTFQLHNGDIFMDMLTDSGVNAMSDQMLAGMMTPDDAYAGSESFFRMRDKLEEIFGMKYCLPAHQGRACENILATRFVKPGNCVIMNYHFTTAKAHITRLGGHVEELVKDEGLVSQSDLPFKGDIDLDKLEACIEKEGADNVSFMRLEAGTNLIGGQPVSVQSFKDACAVARKHGILSVLDASLLQDNLYFIKIRDEERKDMSIRDITREIADQFDMIYFSARKFGFARGGAILVRDEELFHSMEDLVPMFEGFLTYGGMSVREIEAMTVGFDESMDMDIISHGPQFIKYCVDKLVEYGVPIQRAAMDAQESVRKAIESMTGLHVVRVDVHVQSVSFEKENKALQAGAASAALEAGEETESIHTPAPTPVPEAPQNVPDPVPEPVQVPETTADTPAEAPAPKADSPSARKKSSKSRKTASPASESRAEEKNETAGETEENGQGG